VGDDASRRFRAFIRNQKVQPKTTNLTRVTWYSESLNLHDWKKWQERESIEFGTMACTERSLLGLVPRQSCRHSFAANTESHTSDPFIFTWSIFGGEIRREFERVPSMETNPIPMPLRSLCPRRCNVLRMFFECGMPYNRNLEERMVRWHDRVRCCEYWEDVSESSTTRAGWSPPTRHARRTLPTTTSMRAESHSPRGAASMGQCRG
jgi:hypothetical protein